MGRNRLEGIGASPGVYGIDVTGQQTITTEGPVARRRYRCSWGSRSPARRPPRTARSTASCRSTCRTPWTGLMRAIRRLHLVGPDRRRPAARRSPSSSPSPPSAATANVSPRFLPGALDCGAGHRHRAGRSRRGAGTQRQDHRRGRPGPRARDHRRGHRCRRRPGRIDPVQLRQRRHLHPGRLRRRPATQRRRTGRRPRIAELPA